MPRPLAAAPEADNPYWKVIVSFARKIAIFANNGRCGSVLFLAAKVYRIRDDA